MAMKVAELPSINVQNYMKLDDDFKNDHIFAKFITIGDPLPLTPPNISLNQDKEVEELSRIIGTSDSTTADWCCGICCCLSLLGAPYFKKKLVLVPSGSYGFAMNSGVPQLLRPGWHFLASPLKGLSGTVEMSMNPIIQGPVTIVRIPQGCIGTAIDNTKLEILLPGTHCRNSGTFKYSKTFQLNNDQINFNQIKILTILTGTVQICYDVGKATILKEGKYTINSPSFIVGPAISIQQQSLQFSKHNVLLDGGIQMTVEGLLTFQIADVEKMLYNLGAENQKLIASIQNVTKAEISKIFSAIHLEQISSISHEEAINPKAHKVHENIKEALITDSDNIQNEIRIKICEQVVILIKPLLENWGVKVINFQMESIKLTDEKYGMEYEAASLEIAKAKANLKANVAKNEINISKAEMEAKALLIKVEGEKNAKIVAAEGIAKAMTIEAQARNEAAQTLQDNFSKDLLMMQERVNFARELKATTLVISDQNNVAKNVVPMMNI